MRLFMLTASASTLNYGAAGSFDKACDNIKFPCFVEASASEYERSCVGVRKGVATNDRLPLVLPPLEEGIYRANANIGDA
jgi:hypothetical protein